MSDISPISAPPPPPARSPALVVLGILFILLWIAGHVVWGLMALMANVMANDSGAASESRHLSLILGMLAGQVLCAGAGIPAGMAFFSAGRRKRLLGIFAVLFLIGALIQGGVFWFFFSSMS